MAHKRLVYHFAMLIVFPKHLPSIYTEKFNILVETLPYLVNLSMNIFEKTLSIVTYLGSYDKKVGIGNKRQFEVLTEEF